MRLTKQYATCNVVWFWKITWLVYPITKCNTMYYLEVLSNKNNITWTVDDLLHSFLKGLNALGAREKPLHYELCLIFVYLGSILVVDITWFEGEWVYAAKRYYRGWWMKLRFLLKFRRFMYFINYLFSKLELSLYGTRWTNYRHCYIDNVTIVVYSLVLMYLSCC